MERSVRQNANKSELRKGDRVMFNEIKSSEDIKNFLDETNSLHDGYIIGVQYTNQGLLRTEGGYSIDPEQTKLILQICVTSICDTIVEIQFESIAEWQIKDNQWDITDTAVMFNEQQRIVWLDDVYTNMAEIKNGSYVIAKSMKWRIEK